MQDSLQKHLEAWRCYLQRLVIQSSPITSQANSTALDLVPIEFYMGMEGTSEDWQGIVMKRFDSIKFDTLILYRVLSLYLLSDIRTLQILAERSICPAGVPLNMDHCQKTRQWVQQAGSMRALWHAVEVLKSLRTASHCTEGMLDPICHLAWAMARLVIWAHTSYSNQPCDQCGLHLDLYLDRVFELMTAKEGDCEAWILNRSRTSIDGIVLCPCNVDRLMDRICTTVVLKRGWQVADMIAPFAQAAMNS